MPYDIQHYGIGSKLLSPLMKCCAGFNIEEDPYVERLREKGHTAELEEVLASGKTFCNEQLRGFVDRSRQIYEELGGWATDFYIGTSIDRLQESIEDPGQMSDLDQTERIHLLELLRAMPELKAGQESSHVSFKLQRLLHFLAQVDTLDFSGLIFAKRRATVSVLVRILSLHPTTKDRFHCGSFVGWSSNNNRKGSLGDLLHRDMQRDTLEEFRAGRKNLIVATDVLEEGIDISACNLVICFDKPANLKSFVQRRGRARNRTSTFAIMISTEDVSLDIHRWQELEQAMIKMYQDDKRRRNEACELEIPQENVAERLWVEKTKQASPSLLLNTY